MKRKLLDPQEKEVITENQRRIIGTIDALLKQLQCVDCGSGDRLEYYRDGVKICYNCYCRHWKREKRAKQQAG